jgi:peptidoglycan/LPS O-acetylase OafA/YrhL
LPICIKQVQPFEIEIDRIHDTKHPENSTHQFVGTALKTPGPEHIKLEYRPDIDGLRAVAVLLVVIYHGFPDVLSGGFLGVDIFFVLSGFLITSIISRDVDSSVFSLSHFYIGRLRRIFPSLIIVTATILVAGWFILRSEEYSQLGKEVFAGSFFYSNFYYLSQDNYFDAASELKPFLHLWSLSIEEQFYMFYPIILLVFSKLFKTHKFRLFATTTLAIASFAVCLLLAGTPSKSFFLPASRWWELLLGGVLALSCTNGKINFSHPNLFALMGYASIALGVFLASVVESFSTYMGLTVVFGTLLLVAAGQDSELVKQTTGRNLLAGIGKLSYSLYLWHWPILVLARTVYGEQPPTLVRITLIALSFLLALLTTRFLETPIRFRVRRTRTVLLLSSPLLLIGFAGFVVSDTEGFPERAANNRQIKYAGDITHNDFFMYISDNFHPCTPAEIYNAALMWERFVRCNQSKPNRPIDVLLLGDSHAEHLFIGLAEELKNKNVGFYITENQINESDPEFNRIFQAALTNPSIRTVILANMWIEREIPKSELIPVFRKLVDNGKNVYVTDDIPVFAIDPAVCQFYGECLDTEPYAAYFDDHSYLELIAAIKFVPNVTLIETYKYFCEREDICSMRDARKVLYRDSNHLNVDGSRMIGRRIVQEFPMLKD